MSVRIVPAAEGIAEAARRLRDGQLVALPTETVYGLGANALDAAAVAQIFTVKGRPSTNPLIVHVANIAAARALAAPGAWNETAQTLAAHFWPGPLTLVVARADNVPDSVTAGGGTVGLRVPNHPVALELLQMAGVPVAAPSANRSEEVSPTLARHVADSLGSYADDLLILDGGACQVGIESTVLDVTGNIPRILRPGMVTQAQITDVIGEVDAGATAGIARSPGQMLRHYAPSVPVVLTRSLPDALQPGDVYLAWEGKPACPGQAGVVLPAEPEGYAAGIYAALRELDTRNAIRIVIALPPDTPEWAAVHDRLRRAATPKSDRGNAGA